MSLRESQVSKALFEGSNKLSPNLGVLIIGLKVVTFLVAGVTTNWADINHSVSELDKGATLDRYIKIGNVVEAEVDKLLVLVLTNPADEAVGWERLAELVRRQAVFGKTEVE